MSGWVQRQVKVPEERFYFSAYQTPITWLPIFGSSANPHSCTIVCEIKLSWTHTEGINSVEMLCQCVTKDLLTGDYEGQHYRFRENVLQLSRSERRIYAEAGPSH